MIIIVFKQFCKMYDLESVVDHFVCTGAVYTDTLLQVGTYTQYVT